MDYVKLIADIDELKWFYDNVLPPLESTEVYFLSLSARNKYLTEEEREALDLGRTEMFAKTIVRERTWERFVRTIRKLECSEEGYTTKNNSPIPSKCVVCYININPSDTLKALNEFNKVINEYMFELSRVAVKKLNSENIMQRLNKVDNNLMTAYQQATGTKHWIDIDLDVPKEFRVWSNLYFKDWLETKEIKHYYWLDTKSGYHLIIDKNELKFNPQEIVTELYEYLTKYYFCKLTERLHDDEDWKQAEELAFENEIILNKNQMVPLPGLFQADHIVRILNK